MTKRINRLYLSKKHSTFERPYNDKKIKNKVSANIFIAPITIVLFLCLCSIASFIFYPDHPIAFFDIKGPSEIITYIMYGMALVTAIYFWRDFIKTPKQTSYILFLVLWLVALLREMGMQHALASKDTTAIKIRFFTNPDNPLSEKIITAILVLSVVSVIIKLLIQYTPKIIRVFFAFDPLYWTICTFGGIGIVSKFADRFPSNYYKSTGVRLNETTEFLLKLVEEGGEACLPLLFAMALWQYHIQYKKKTN